MQEVLHEKMAYLNRLHEETQEARAQGLMRLGVAKTLAKTRAKTRANVERVGFGGLHESD